MNCVYRNTYTSYLDQQQKMNILHIYQMLNAKLLLKKDSSTQRIREVSRQNVSETSLNYSVDLSAYFARFLMVIKTNMPCFGCEMWSY